ncbi:MAG: hypothetical protein HYR74_03300 [Candidatus Eisenbacteria bacterium]|nr:hypothetical protein [Candidatus Eisenbacteria bacterium]
MATRSPLATRSLLVAIALAALSGVAGAADRPFGSIDFTLGYKHMSSDWMLGTPKITANTDTSAETGPTQPGLGIETTWGRPGWPVSIAFDVMHSYDDGLQHFPLVNLGVDSVYAANVRRRASTLEIGLGVRRAWMMHDWAPYLGAGGNWMHATLIDQVIDPAIGPTGAVVGGQRGHDSAFGYWVGGGLERRVGPRCHIGLTFRVSRAKLDAPDTRVVGEVPHYRFVGTMHQVEAGGTHFGLVMGWAFPDSKK